MISRESLAATVAVKWMIQEIEGFTGPSSELKTHLLQILREKEARVDENLAETFLPLVE